MSGTRCSTGWNLNGSAQWSSSRAWSTLSGALRELGARSVELFECLELFESLELRSVDLFENLELRSVRLLKNA